MDFRQIKETCIYFSELESAREFYHIKLELPIISYVKGKHIFFRAGNSVLLCFNPDDSRTKQSPPGHYSKGKYHFAFEVAPEEYELHKAKVLEKGIKIIDKEIGKRDKSHSILKTHKEMSWRLCRKESGGSESLFEDKFEFLAELLWLQGYRLRLINLLRPFLVIVVLNTIVE